VKQAYRELARKVHPDFGEEPDGSLMMKINAAWEKAQAELRM
jgi:DnaJ-class molecular chaperone